MIIDGLPTSGERTGGNVPAGAFSALLQELAAAPANTADQERPALHAGQVIGRFEIVRELGRGGFGVVYEARDRDLGRAVAFKVVRSNGAPDVREARLLGEAEAAARLSHPNIVMLHDLGRCDEGPYLVLEMLQGHTLARRLEHGALPVREAVRIGVEVAKGLAHAHERDVVHRDLTPGNVFLCDDGQVKVLDFGMAHAFGRRKVEGGTGGYMAPEQRSGAPEDERTDVFALGVVLYEMLSGERPATVASGAPPCLEIPEEPALANLVARMLAQDPVKRPRDGAELVGALTALRDEMERAPPGPAAAVRSRRRPSSRARRGAMLGLAAAVLAIITLGGWYIQRQRGRRSGVSTASVAGAATAPSIAVLPFADMSAQRDQEYFADGIAEEILNALAGVEELRVPGRTSSFYFKGKSAKLAEIGHDLGVANVLEGSVRKDGQRIRITAQVVSVSDGYHLWSHTYDRELKDVFAVQDEIARAVVDALKVKLLPASGPPAMKHRPANPEAYSLYVLGRSLDQRASADSFRRAAPALEKAVALEPGFPLAYVWLAVARGNLARLAVTSRGSEPARQASEAAEKAIALDPDLPEAYAVRGWLRTIFDWDWAGAQADMERALALRPNDPVTFTSYGVLLQKLGRLPDAIAWTRRAIELDPLHAIAWGNLGSFYIDDHQLDLGRRAIERALEISPENVGPADDLGRLALFEGRPAEALRIFERFPGEAFAMAGRAIALHELGRHEGSRSAVEELVARHGGDAPYYVAQVLAWRGERDAAFEWLGRAHAGNDLMMRNLKCDPLLRNLRSDARYTALLRKMKFPLD